VTSRIDPAEYALGLLDGSDLAEARRLEEHDPVFAAETRALARVGTRLSTLDPDEWSAAGPPPLRLGAATVAPPQTPAARPRESWIDSLRDRLGSGLNIRPAFAAACAAVLLGIGVAAGLLAAGGDNTAAPSGPVVALDRFDSGPAGASGRATVSKIGGVTELTLDTRGLKPSAPGSSYEVWMIRDAKHMVGLGRFKVGPKGRATVTLPATVNPADYPIMDVSIEPDDGPASHSGVSVLRSPASPA
jgi:anti-sigma-K factor RskA